MARLLKRGKPFKSVKVVVAKDGSRAKAVGKIVRGRFKEPPAKKPFKPTPTPAPDAGKFKGKF